MLKPALFAFRLLFAWLLLAGVSSAADVTGSAKLAWNMNPETNIAGYRVKYGTTSGAPTQSALFDWSATTATISNLQTGATYYFAIQAYNIYGIDGELSDEVSAFIPVPTAPEISIEQAPSLVLADGQTGVVVGNVNPGSSGMPQTFVIRNLGTADLTGLSMGADGADLSNFQIAAGMPVSSIVSTNGGFESSLASWTSSGNVRTVTNTAATEGTILAEFNYSNTSANGVLSQSFTTIPGTTYTLSFDAGVLAYNTNQQALRTDVTGSGSLLSKTVTLTGPGDGSTRWTAQSFTFVANSATTTVTFTDISSSTAAIDLRLDNVRVTPPAVIPSTAVTTLAPGASTTFTVTFTPSSLGTKSASIHVYSNDADENPFDIGITGSGAGQPEISVHGASGEDLTDNTAVVAFSNSSLGSISPAETFVIQNTGSSNLTNLAISLDGPNSSEFVIDSLETSVLAPGASTSIRAYFRPTSNGAKTAYLRIASNDADENPLDITLTGNGLATPEISVEHTLAGDLTDGDSMVSFSNSSLGTLGAPQTFTIHNTGNAELTGIHIHIDGDNQSDFVVTTLADETVAPGGSTTFQIAFRPSVSDTLHATVHVTSNDADENPFDIALVGNGIAVPEIAIERANGTNLTHASANVAFSGVNLGSSSAAETFVIRNRGTADLTDISVALVGENPSDFVITGPAVGSLASGASATFKLAFKPGAAGNRSATLHVFSNDANESPFDISLTGYGIALPEITVERANGTVLANDSATVSFGSIILGSSSAQDTLVVRNTGTANLNNIAVSINGGQAADFIIDGPGVTSLAPGASATIKLRFKPLSAGSRAAAIHIASNDTEHNPFNVSLAGTGVAVPEIGVVRADGTDLVDGAASIGFNATNIGSTSGAQILTIQNSGTASLTGISATIDGAQASEFTLEGPAVDSIAPGASTNLKLYFKPGAAGNRRAAIHIASNDSDENPFDINLSGTGVAVPEIAIERSNGTNLADGAATVSFSAATLGSTSAAETLTIRNPGTADLTDIFIDIDGAHASDFVVTGPIIDSLSPGSATTFKVYFRPTVSGPRSASILVYSNDADENPFTIHLAGNGIALPDISVALANETPFPASPASVGFENVKIGFGSAARTFTVSNVGTANLTSLALTVDGAQASDFLLETSGTNTLAPGALATFRVIFKPTGPGNREATLHIASNDPDTNPFDIRLSGYGVAVPQLTVLRANGSPVAAYGEEIPFGSVKLGSVSYVESLHIRNSGTANLTNLAATLDELLGPDFIVSDLETDTLAPGTSTVIRISFSPSAAGPLSAALRITSNDSESGPCEIMLSGTGVAFPVVAVETSDGTRIQADSPPQRFDSVIVGSTGTPRTFTIRNIGTATLTGLRVTTTGAGFIAGAPEAVTIEPGAAANVSVWFKPLGGGTKTSVLRISNTYAPESPFEVVLTADAITVPGIEIFDSEGASLSSGLASGNFGSLDLIANQKTRTYTMRNTGSAPLTDIVISKEGANAADFSIVNTGAATVSPGAFTTFTIAFKPGATGNRSASIIVKSNAGDRPLVLGVSGKGTSAPEIRIMQASKDLKSGDAFINFGGTVINTRADSRTFTISNIGSAPLEKISIYKNGINPGDITFSNLKTDTLAPGASATFTVNFKPAETGIRWAALHVLSNDSDERSFDIVLTGKGNGKQNTIKKTRKKGHAHGAAAAAIASVSEAGASDEIAPVKGFEIIGGLKYRTLTITKTAGTEVRPRDIEVSSDLIDWASGSDHTTVVRNTATTLTVRDNIPVTAKNKRHIRLKR